jgi:hypothetical protein
MSSLLESPRVTVYIGDGFKFLSDNEGTYDCIITDSSDPVGPAQSLFQKSYIHLLHDALAPGGHIATQGECLWLHLPLIREMQDYGREIFPVCEYAFTTIPTYPSGQIGFLLCSKQPGRDLKTPVRKVMPTKYYNESVHKAAFVLPEFARSWLRERKDIQPALGRAATTDTPVKKILLLGSGYVARPCAEYLVRDPANVLTVGELCDIVPLGHSLKCFSLSHTRQGPGTSLWFTQYYSDFSRCCKHQRP